VDDEHQEGRGIGDDVPLRERSKALKGEPHERIWPEIWSAGTGRIKASRGCENLKAQALGRWEARAHHAAALRGETL
jgi:hypothetical protein